MSQLMINLGPLNCCCRILNVTSYLNDLSFFAWTQLGEVHFIRCNYYSRHLLKVIQSVEMAIKRSECKSCYWQTPLALVSKWNCNDKVGPKAISRSSVLWSLNQTEVQVHSSVACDILIMIFLTYFDIKKQCKVDVFLLLFCSNNSLCKLFCSQSCTKTMFFQPPRAKSLTSGQFPDWCVYLPFPPKPDLMNDWCTFEENYMKLNISSNATAKPSVCQEHGMCKNGYSYSYQWWRVCKYFRTI